MSDEFRNNLKNQMAPNLYHFYTRRLNCGLYIQATTLHSLASGWVAGLEFSYLDLEYRVFTHHDKALFIVTINLTDKTKEKKDRYLLDNYYKLARIHNN